MVEIKDLRDFLANARLIAAGKYLELGEKMARRQRPITAELVRKDVLVGR